MIARRARQLLACVLLLATACARSEATYQLVLRGGRVMDPASGLDSIRDVAIQDGRIVAISAQPLQGIEIVDVTGKVVAPGFVDLHAHGQTTGDMQLQARDGVTRHGKRSLSGCAMVREPGRRGAALTTAPA